MLRELNESKPLQMYKDKFHNSATNFVHSLQIQIIGFVTTCVDFDLKSIDGVIKIVEKVIVGNDGNPSIMEDRVSMVPKVIPVKFDSKIHAEAIVRSHAGNHFDFPYKSNDF